MKKIFLLLAVPFLSVFAFAQHKIEADKLVDEGIAYHDKGDFNGAISKYEKALELDKDNLSALAEKSFSLLSLNKYDEAINFCKKAIQIHPKDSRLKNVYVTYGNALDAAQETDKALDIYDEGIKAFPNYYQLYFNKGITLSSIKKYDEAIKCFQKSLVSNPNHASSNNALARLLYTENKIPSLFAFGRFLILEPNSGRSKENAELLQKIMKANVEKTGENSLTINIDSKSLGDTTADGRKKENNFSITEITMSMNAALDFDDKYSKKTDVENFIRKFETVCSSVSETQKDNFGFYWNYYVPYFIEMKNKKLIETFAYIALLSTEKPEVTNWIKSHKKETDKFYAWDKDFEWNKK